MKQICETRMTRVVENGIFRRQKSLGMIARGAHPTKSNSNHHWIWNFENIRFEFMQDVIVLYAILLSLTIFILAFEIMFQQAKSQVCPTLLKLNKGLPLKNLKINKPRRSSVRGKIIRNSIVQDNWKFLQNCDEYPNIND